jgi:hypothetical protein
VEPEARQQDLLKEMVLDRAEMVLGQEELVLGEEPTVLTTHNLYIKTI